jgi:hypothetical protein
VTCVAALEQQLDREQLQRLQVEAAAKLDTLRDELDAVNEALRSEVDGNFALPAPVIPEPELNGDVHGLPLIDSSWTWAEQTLALKASKGYRS